MTLVDFGYPVLGPLALNYLAFHFERHLMKVVPETRRAH
jgi:hypothetical protein